MLQPESALPVDIVLPEVLARLDACPRLIIAAQPGAGKTTRVPAALLAASWCSGRILMLEPRRLAARAAAAHIARQFGESLGERVGYRVRFEKRVSAATRIEVVTEGILTRMIQSDPMLEGISAVIFDEFHERNLVSDLGLAFALDVQRTARPDLRLLVMSASLDEARVAAFLDAPVVSAPGRTFPVEIRHIEGGRERGLTGRLRQAVLLALAETAGDVLCFVPGKAEIARCLAVFAGIDAELVALHGELAVADQALALGRHARRRVVVATNVAESSVTLPDVTAVVDSGLAREVRFDPASGMSRLTTVTITAPSAAQRAGRAGRLGPGVCYRLWPRGQRLEPAMRPEIAHADLAGFVLELKAWGARDLRLLDPPPAGAAAQAEALLHSLGAVDAAGRLTAHGRQMLALGVSPRLANALLRAAPTLRTVACDLAAVLESRDPLRGSEGARDELMLRLEALWSWRDDRRHAGPASAAALAGIDRAAGHWRQRLGLKRDAWARCADADLGLVLAHAYPDRIACRDADSPLRYRLASGRGARLHDDSSLKGTPWLVVAELRFDPRDSLIQRAVPLTEASLEAGFAHHFSVTRVSHFERSTLAVETWESRRFAAIELERRRVPTPRNAETATLLAAGIVQSGLSCLPWSAALLEWRGRVAFLRRACPELGLPEVSDAALAAAVDDWLPPLVAGRLGVGEITPSELARELEARLDYAARRALAEHAPESVIVPSGARRALDYTQGEVPVLAVKLQELFGLAESPRVARGRVPVLLHLLSPRRAPIQVTDDLRSFWARTYPEVKKELKGRYPRHPWPDDPWRAMPTARVKPRR